MVINLYQETTAKGKTYLHLLDYPGLIIKGSTVEEGLACLGVGTQSYMRWRKRHGFTYLEHPYEFKLVEEKRGGPFHPGNDAAFFEYDRKIVTGAERQEFLQLMEASRKDLLTILYGMPVAAFELYIETLSWSINEILRHIATAERFYITRLFEPGSIPRSPVKKDIFDRLQYMRETCVEILQNLTLEERTKTTFTGNDEWSANKVFRRYLEHEREHIGQILRILYHHGLEGKVKFDMREMIEDFRGISWKEEYECE